jgi:hypothetical protein
MLLIIVGFSANARNSSSKKSSFFSVHSKASFLYGISRSADMLGSDIGTRVRKFLPLEAKIFWFR